MKMTTYISKKRYQEQLWVLWGVQDDVPESVAESVARIRGAD